MIGLARAVRGETTRNPERHERNCGLTVGSLSEVLAGGEDKDVRNAL